jgi:cell wall-associated NlpC family hydrolase
MRHTIDWTRRAALLAVASLLAPAWLGAQVTRFEAGYGAWFPSGDSVAQVFHAGVGYRLLGPVGAGAALVHVADSRSLADRTLTGGEFTLRVGQPERGLYALAGTGIGFRHASGNADAFWTAGGGVAFELFRGLALGVEVRYRAEDTGGAGFWQLAPGDRKGLQAQARISFGIPGSGSAAARQEVAPPAADGPAGTVAPTDTAALDPYNEAVSGGASEESARLRASVVETALAAMGSPYRWGGSGANGFDCSGLIQYAYSQHGIVLPRMSRDQARMGVVVDRAPTALRPGDILGFSQSGAGESVTHVGLYVGDGRFIHSSSTGVKLSSLEAADPESNWWRNRWVAARRIVE